MALGANPLCLLPAGRYLCVSLWAPSPCGGYYVHEAWVYGDRGRVGYWLDDQALNSVAQPLCHLAPLAHYIGLAPAHVAFQALGRAPGPHLG